MKYLSLVLLIACPPLAFGNLQYGLRVTSGKMSFVTGSKDQTYVETEGLLRYDFSQVWGIEGSVFGRFADDEDYWGVSASTPLSLVLSKGVVKSYIAPGYRYMNTGYGAPTLEGGVRIHYLQALSLGVGFGYRFVFNEWVKNGLETEGQFFISVY